MDQSSRMPPQTSLFQVYLRLRPPIDNGHPNSNYEQWLIVEPPSTASAEDPGFAVSSASRYITLQPPNDSRKRAVERFSFTKVFQQEATQLDIFEETGTVETLQNLLREGRDGLVATLGVTGSGKSHTILGSRSQRGLTQMTLDVLFRSIGQNIRCVEHPDLLTDFALLGSLQACDASEAHIMPSSSFLESIYGDIDRSRHSRAQTPMTGIGSRAQTPMTVWLPVHDLPGSFPTPSQQDRTQSSYLYPAPAPVSGDLGPSLNSNYFGAVTPTVRLLPVSPQTLPRKESVLPSRLPFCNRISYLKEAFAKPWSTKEPTLPPPQHRRHLPTRPSALPQTPDVSNYSIEVDHKTDYVVLISMYEVYNDRIFDLLSSSLPPHASQMTTRQGALLQKTLSRRPLLFKSTEMSPDRKVVAGLRKVLCRSYDEAMMVLETGLHERRVAGTGSNSVSSRSHGFFCIEVKQNKYSSNYGSGDWTGGTMSIVDLAGSERARNAKTTGSTLAEAGKINESLMYLGQCLQVQSDCQQDGSKPIVPFRQCKLTELLFSNSFPSTTSHHATFRTPQKATMIVTADPQGDFNATSQILRYSALAREVTVPRIPSVTSTILNATSSLKTASGGRTSPSATSAEDLEQVANEIARLSEECDHLAMRLAEEEIRRQEADLKVQAAEEKAIAIEQAIREECWVEMEAKIDEERGRWRKAWEEEKVKGEEYLDEKIEILGKDGTFQIHEDQPIPRVKELERENANLKAKFGTLEREMLQRSPTKNTKEKPLVLQENSNINPATNPFLCSLRGSLGENMSMADKLENLELRDVSSARKASLRQSTVLQSQSQDETTIGERKVSVPKTPGTTKKQRKLTTRKWDFGEIGTDEE